MTRLRAALYLMVLAVAPATAQVGYKPSESPFRDLNTKQQVTLFAGGFDTGRDEAGVGPQPGWLAGAQYSIVLGGPIALTARVAAAPTSRRLLDPTKLGAARYIGDQNSQIMVSDLGLEWNLTGQKSFHRLVPLIQGGAGFVTDFHGIPDDAGYRFGTRLMLSWGAAVRYHTNGRWEPRVQFTNYLWQLNYPAAYGNLGSDGSPALVKNAKHSPWMGNHLFSVGLSRRLFR